MATADKLTTVAENVPKVYHAGQMNIVENAECLKGSKTDTAILLDDISPVSHEMGVKVRSKNLFDPLTVKYSGLSTVELQDGNIITVSQSSKSAYISANFKIPNANSLIGKTITISANARTSGANQARVRCLWMSGNAAEIVAGMNIISKNYSGTDGTVLYASGEVKPYLKSSNKLCVLLYSNTEGSLEANTTYTATYSDIQIEIADAATTYTPYVPDLTAVKVIKLNGLDETVAEYTPTADGTVNGVTSLYPNTTLLTDRDGVIIDCDYYKDIDKAFNELSSAIALSGGE